MNEGQSRFSLALDFACAAVTVLLSGRVADRVISERGAGVSQRLAHIPSSDFHRRGKYHGVLASVARELNFSRDHISKVKNGQRPSRRVVDAILAEVARIDSRSYSLAEPLPLTVEERREFRLGRKYCGIYAVVARQLGKHKTTASQAGRGLIYSPIVLRAIRAEMSRVDAELEAKAKGGVQA